MKLDFAYLMYTYEIESFKYQMVTQNLYVVYQDGNIEEYGKNSWVENFPLCLSFWCNF